MLRLTERFDRAELGPDELRVPPAEIDAAVAFLEPAVLRAGCAPPSRNVRAVVDAQLREPVSVDLPEGQRVEVAEVPVRARRRLRAGRPRRLSVDGDHVRGDRARGRRGARWPRARRPGPEGRAHPVILAACALCGVNEVYRMGGAQAIAALAYGTESVRPVDVIAGPGNAYVQEAKRQVVGQVGIDGIAGPSELVVVASIGADPELIALDLLGPGRARRGQPAGA